MMADENRSDFKHNSYIGVERISSVIDAFERDEIKLKRFTLTPCEAGFTGWETRIDARARCGHRPGAEDCALAASARGAARRQKCGALSDAGSRR